MKNNLSVFGSTGFIGNSFISLYDSACISRESNKPIENTDVLYLISTTHNYHVFNEPLLDIETNLVKLINVLQNFKETCFNRTFNFISSWFVYGDTDFPATELSVCKPKGFYSITKYTAEQMIKSYCQTFGLNYRIMRLCNVYGESATGVSKKRNALQFMIRQIIGNQEVKLYDNGQNVRDFMHVNDVCKAIKLCIDKGDVNSTINIGSGIPQTFRPLMEYVKNKVSSSSILSSVDPPDFHKAVQVRDMYLDISKLKQLGFKQQVSIYDGIDKIIGKELCLK